MTHSPANDLTAREGGVKSCFSKFHLVGRKWMKQFENFSKRDSSAIAFVINPFTPKPQSVHSPNLFKKECISEVVREW